jgi:hypothetical protein
MLNDRYAFSQLIDSPPRREFDRCVARSHGNRRTRNFSCLDQFLCRAFAQLTYRESLRDIETCPHSLQRKLYHAGFRGVIARSTLADANKHRDWRIDADFARVLIARARRPYQADGFGVQLEQPASAPDSTTIDLCPTPFPWAPFRRHKAAIKPHTLIDPRGNLPGFARITHGKTHDVTILDGLPIEPGAFSVMDRAYLDFGRLHRLKLGLAFVVTRARSNLDFGRRSSRRVGKTTGVCSDQTIILCGPRPSKLDPDPLRRVAYRDAEAGGRLVLSSNSFDLPALTIANIDRSRWQVEPFFRWIKQHLRIKSFYGTSRNAVKTQVWIAICIYVLVAIIRKGLNVEHSLREILQILSVSLFEKPPINEALSLEKRINGGE